MNRAEYRAARSLARQAERELDIYLEQIDGWSMNPERVATLDRKRAALVAATERVPGGLTKPYHCYCAPLLAEWIPRHNAVRNAIRLRHIAERGRVMPVAARRAA